MVRNFEFRKMMQNVGIAVQLAASQESHCSMTLVALSCMNMSEASLDYFSDTCLISCYDGSKI
jgi:hypothetical protein